MKWRVASAFEHTILNTMGLFPRQPTKEELYNDAKKLFMKLIDKQINFGVVVHKHSVSSHIRYSDSDDIFSHIKSLYHKKGYNVDITFVVEQWQYGYCSYYYEIWAKKSELDSSSASEVLPSYE